MDFKIFFCLLFFMIIFSINANGHSKRNDKRSNPTYNEDEKKRAMEKFVDGVKIITGAVIADAIPFGGTFFAFTVGLYDAFTKEQKTLWGQIKTHVKEAIDKSLSEYANDALRNDLDEAEVKIIDGRDEIYNDIKALGEKVFPMKWESRPYDDVLPLYTIRYVIYLVQAYQIGMERGKIDKCILKDLLATVKTRMISSMKEMIRKKYRKVAASTYDDDPIQYINYTIGNPEVKSNEFQASILSKGLKEEGIRVRLPSSKSYRTWVRTFYSFQYHIEKFKKETMDYLMLIVSAVNKFFNDEICMGCSGCPTPIKREDFDLDWPTNCYDKDLKCQHPCGDFSQDENPWCWLKDHDRGDLKWERCTPIDVRCCITLDFDVNPDRCKQKKKAKKKASKKENQNV